MLDTPFSDTFEVVCDANDLNYEDFFFYYRNGDTVNELKTPKYMNITADDCINIYLHKSVFAQSVFKPPWWEDYQKELKKEDEKEQIFKAALKSYNHKCASEHLLFIEEVKRKKARSSMFYMDRLD